MKNTAAEISVQAWESEGILLERYAYTSGAIEPLSKHSHEEYQFGLSLNCQGEYFYRGAFQAIPIGSLSVIHSGEVHSPSDRTYLPSPANFVMMHVKPTGLQSVAAEMFEKPATLPFFPTAFLTDSNLNALFLALHEKTSKLEQDVALWDFLTYLIRHYAANCPAVHPVKSADAAVMVARDYLHTHYANDISLETLATIAGLSHFHFCRIFRKALGVSPHVYQTQLRIAQAKKLLIQRMPISMVAAMTGFYDQSHFGWHFKRYVGVTPRRYIGKVARFS
ncbi:hypothetical protein C7B76_25025 [filamentous cyanobacterium CCP2]|nr:hypothetical protein C7B76_25025 [filamentous cyanobacterium CCP2]